MLFTRHYHLAWWITLLLLYILQVSAQHHARHNQDASVLDKISALMDGKNLGLLNEIAAYTDIKTMELEQRMKLHMDEKITALEERMKTNIENQMNLCNEMSVKLNHIEEQVDISKEAFQQFATKLTAQGGIIHNDINILKDYGNSSNLLLKTMYSETNKLYTVLGTDIEELDTDLNITIVETNFDEEVARYGFYVNGSLIVPTQNATKCTWENALKQCEDLGAEPFVPMTRQHFEIIAKVYRDLDYPLWVPASEATQEGELKWWNGQDASGSEGLVWYADDYLHYNSDRYNCVTLGSTSGLWMRPCSRRNYPMVCSRVVQNPWFPFIY